MKIDYYDEMCIAKTRVLKELPVFAVLIPSRKIRLLDSNIREYCNARGKANRYKRLEEKDPSNISLRKESEREELLQATFLTERLGIMSEDELKIYVEHLGQKLKEALKETDTKKRYKLYDYIIAGCSCCKVQYDSIMQNIAQIKENAKTIIQEIPMM